MLDLGSLVTSRRAHKCAWLLVFAAACADRGLTNDAVRDAVAPRLDVRTPLRGSIQPGDDPIEVRGTVGDEQSGVAEVTVNDTPAVLAGDGSFVAKVKPVPGITLLHTVVTDNAGNQQSDTRAVLGGALVPVDTMVPDGIVVSLDGNALHAAAQLAARGLDAIDLSPLVEDLNPIIDVPVPCLGARVDISHVSKGPAQLTLEPVEGGLAIDGSIADVEVDLHVAYDVGCNPGTADIVMTADRFHLVGTLLVGVDGDGQLTVDTSETSATFDGFVLDASLLPDEVVNIIEQPLGATLAGVIADQVQSQLPVLLKDMLGGEDQAFDVDGQVLDVAFRPTRVEFTDAGVQVEVDSRMLLEGSPGAVFLSTSSGRPTFDGLPTRSARIAVAESAVNQMMSSLWSAGIFDRTFTVDEAGSYAGLGVLFDRVELATRLPPVVTALPNGGGVRVSLGDVECHFIKAEPGQPVRTVTRLSMSAETTVAVTVKDNKLSLVASDPVVWLDVLRDGVSGSNPFDTADNQELGSFVARNLIGYASQVISKVRIPTLEGMTIVDAEVATGGANGGYVIVSGNVRVR